MWNVSVPLCLGEVAVLRLGQAGVWGERQDRCWGSCRKVAVVRIHLVSNYSPRMVSSACCRQDDEQNEDYEVGE